MTDKYFHSMENLFKQLGLGNTEKEILEFIRSHQTSSSEIMQKLPFWNNSQADFLETSVNNDSDWSEIVDELDTRLRTPSNRKLSQVNELLYNKIFLSISFALKTAILTGSLFCFIWGHLLLGISSLIVLIVSILPYILGRHFQVKIPPEFDFLAVFFIFITLYLGNIQDFYLRFWWWDILLHTSSGFMLGIAGFLMIFLLNGKADIHLNIKPHFMALFSFTFAITLGTLWEILEFGMDQLLGMNMQMGGIVDTMWDLIVDTLGALIISLLGWAYYKKMESSSFLIQWLEHFIRDNPSLFKLHD